MIPRPPDPRPPRWRLTWRHEPSGRPLVSLSAEPSRAAAIEVGRRALRLRHGFRRGECRFIGIEPLPAAPGAAPHGAAGP